MAAGHHLHVAELAGQSVLAAVDVAVADDGAADAGAERDHDHVVLAAAGAEAPFGPGGGVGVVLDHDGEAEPGAERLLEGFAAPVEVGGEEHGGAFGVDPAGRADADRVDVVLVGELQDEVDDDVLDDLGALALVGGLGAQPVQDASFAVDHAGHDLGAADVDADGGQAQHPGGQGAAAAFGARAEAQQAGQGGSGGAVGTGHGMNAPGFGKSCGRVVEGCWRTGRLGPERTADSHENVMFLSGFCGCRQQLIVCLTQSDKCDVRTGGPCPGRPDDPMRETRCS